MTFTQFTRADLESILTQPFSVEVVGRELVYAWHCQKRACKIRLYSTISSGASEVRSKGADAIRINTTNLAGPRLLRLRPNKPRHIKRTGTLDSLKRRIKAELKAEAAALRSIPICPKHGPGTIRSGSYGAFVGCCIYPHCKWTAEVPETYKENYL